MNIINSKTVIIGLTALVMGIVIGVKGTELKAGQPVASRSENATNQSPATVMPNPISTGQAWDPFQEMQDMQMQMDTLFNQMSAEFRMEPKFSGIVDQPAYSLSLNVRDLKDRFVVRAFLPDTKVSDVNVKLENNQTLKVEVSNQQDQTSDKKDTATNVAEWGQYEQVIQLPASVNAGQMKIERKDHELVITLPKA